MVRVIDGDTIQVRLASRRVVTVRYIGVNAPEYTTKRECFGKEASAYNTSPVLGAKVAVPNTVRLQRT